MSILADGYQGSGAAWDFGAGRLLKMLSDGDCALTLEELRAHGIEMPAQAIYTLQLAGYVIDRVPTAGQPGSHLSGYRLRPADDRSDGPNPKRLSWSPLGGARSHVQQGETR